MVAPLRIPLAAYEPDLPDFPGAGSAVVKNVYPKTPLSYGPVRGPAPIYDALGSTCVGAVAYIDNTGNITLFAGDKEKLYYLQPGLSAWVNASNPALPYDADAWRFSVFNGDVIAASRNHPPQFSPLLGAIHFDTLPGNPPYGRYIAVVKNAFVVLGDTYDPNDNSSWDDRLQWCAAGNHKDWPIAGTTDAAEKQSGSVRLHGPLGRIQGIASGLAAADAVVFQRFGAQRMSYSGPPTTFSILPVDSARGCAFPSSIVVQNGIAYYWSDDGIFAFNGQEGHPIGVNKIDRTVYADLSPSAYSRVVGASDPRRQLLIWAYPSSLSPDATPDRLLFYSPPLGRFSLCEVTCEIIVKMLTVGYTLVELETVLGYETLAELPYPLNSEVWRGGVPYIGIFDTDHRLNFLDGTPLAATVDTGELQLTEGRRQLLTGARPLVDGNGATAAVSIGVRERLQEAVTWRGPFAMNGLGACPLRASGRYVRARIDVPASELWNDISGVELDPVRQGRR